MIGSRRWVLLAIGLGLTAFSVGLVLGRPVSSRAQQPVSPATAPVPADSNYVGADTCKGCHEEQYNKFAKTRMGRIFLFQARTPGEKNACENCHGPGAAHVAAEKAGPDTAKALAARESLKLSWPQAKSDVCIKCHDSDNSPEFSKNPDKYWSEIEH